MMDNISELSDYEMDPSVVQSGPSSSNKEEPLVLDRQHHACLTTWLVLRILRHLELSSSDLASSNSPKELTERILRELSASSSSAKLEEVLNGTFVELLQWFGEEGSVHKALNPRDSTFDEALMTALRKHLDADASTPVPEEVKSAHSKKRKGLFSHLKMPTLFKKKSRKNKVGPADQDPLQSGRTAAMGGSSNAEEKPRRRCIFSRMFSCFRKSCVFCFDIWASVLSEYINHCVHNYL
ncbi:hypothetical protein SRHO_G00140080 [Serrasalmus rhombeus]